MTIQARYSGECPDCGEWWQPGDLIRHNGDEWVHVVCSTDLPLMESHPAPCPKCWQVPAASGACGCDTGEAAHVVLLTVAAVLGLAIVLLGLLGVAT